VNKKIYIFGASTLKAYSEGILAEGFKSLGNSAEMLSSEQGEAAENDAAVVQIHGSPEAEAEDRILLALAENRLRTKKSPTAILLHRPDEIELRFSAELGCWKFSSSSRAAFVLLGTMFATARFLSETGLPTQVIPHGFFNSDERRQEDPIVVGAHTGWGEMRSLKHAIQLLAALFAEAGDLPIVGYLGGGPKRELELTKIDELLVEAGLKAFELVHVSQLRLPVELAPYPRIIISHEGAPPPGLGLTFNLQLYHLNGTVRRGESSGSLHRGLSVPVILEMNGAEVLEDLRVIKVPYSDPLDASSADWNTAAMQILADVRSGDYRAHLAHNAAQAKKFSPQSVAEQYIELFQRLP
jgi:hypothetical protein